MDSKKDFNQKIAAFGWGLLLVWWGIVIMFHPITIGMGAIGTGVILLGLSIVRMAKGVPARESTTNAGIITLTWGILDQVRVILGMSDAISFAMLVIIIGVYICIRAGLYITKRTDEIDHQAR